MGAGEFQQLKGLFEASAWLTRGQQASEACRFEQAREAYGHALKLMPRSIDALRGLGYALFQLRRLSEALETLERALKVDPSDLLSHLLMGRLCLRLQQAGGAIEHFRAILKRIENSAAARSGLVDAYLALGQMSKADELCETILREEPKSELGHLVAAKLAGLKNDDDTALTHFEWLVQTRPQSAAHRYNRGLCLLRLGRFDEGWRDYENRFAAGAVNLCLPQTPRWDGQRVPHLLVVTEQGLGDAILFSRFIADAADRADRVTLVCPPTLRSLFQRSLPCQCISGDEWPTHDAHVPMMSLPHVLGLGESAVHPRAGWLQVDDARRQAWAELLPAPADGCVRIGLVHATSVAHPTEENPWTRRSCSPADLEALTRITDVTSYCLDRDHAAERACQRLSLLRRLPQEPTDFDDTAALIDCMDLVVSVDTACAHLAGAIGRPPMLMLPPSPDWKWQLRPDVQPWYTGLQRLDAQGTAGRSVDFAALLSAR